MAGQRSDAGSACPQCGSPLPVNARFCAVCGHMTNTRQTQQVPLRTSQPPVVVASVARPAVPDQIEFAGRGVRCSSFLLDVAAMISPALPLSIAGAMLGVAEVVYIVVPVAFAAVWTWMQIWQGLTGKSFGKVMLGLRLIRTTDHRPAGVAATLLRGGMFLVTFGLSALPVMTSRAPCEGWHDRVSGLAVLDVSMGANPLGRRPQTLLRRSADRRIQRVHSPVPVARRG